MCRTVSINIFLLSKLSQIVSQKSKLAFFAHIMSHMNYVSNAWDGCAGVHMKQLYSLHKGAVKFLMPIPNLDYKQKCCALKLLPLDKQLLLNKCVLMQKVVHGKAPQYLKDLMIPSERLHVHENKQLLPRTRIDIFKTSFSFSGFLAWNSPAHHLRYPMELKRLKEKHFRHLLSHLEYFVILLLFFSLSSFFFSLVRQLDTKCIESCYCFPFLALIKF